MSHTGNGAAGDSDGYNEIPNSIIKQGERYDFRIFIKVKGGYHLLLDQCMPFTEQHSRILKSSQTKAFASSKEWGKVLEYKTLHLSSILEDPDVSIEDKADIATSTSMESIEQIIESTEARNVRHMEPRAEEMVKLILSDERVMHNLVWVSAHDHFTYQHSVRVGIFATALTMKLYQTRLSKAELSTLSEGYFLHDLGMARVPLSILDKRGNLTVEEWATIRKHPEWGLERLRETGHLTPVTEGIVLSHHERKNGRGYPKGLAGDDIPVFAKICALADVFESLTAVRPYRRPKDTFNALKVIQLEMSGEFDLEMLKAFILMLGPKG